jgi:carbon-monoxide dehydrogenase medium subunit
MKSAPFIYHRPESQAELTACLALLDNVRILAGGQSLVPMLNMRYAQPDHVVDINRIADLSGIRTIGDDLEIGAMTRQVDIAASPEVTLHAPLLIEALSHVGHRQTRARGTIGGSLCHLDPAAELPSCALALDATLIVGSDEGDRKIAADKWFLGYMTPNLAPTEYLKAIRIANWAPRYGYAFMEFARRHGDFALASSICLLAADAEGRMSRATVVVSGLDVRPIRCVDVEARLVGEYPGEDLWRSAASALDGLDVVGDAYGGADYRRHLARVLTKRALERAAGRLGEQSHGR